MSSPNPTSTTSSRPGAVRGPSTTSDLSFRGDLQGLRGIAVLVVVAFHVGLAGFDGGFIGVDVFFVISGFLITRILSRQVTGRHGVALVDFWARRIRRLVPALFVVVVATLLLGLLVYSPLGWSDLAQQAGASALYVSNILFAREATIYFGTAIEASPYLHTWSLGVEEQFYLFWPFLFLGLALVLRRRSRWTIAIPAALGVVLVASFALSYVLTDRGSPWAFFSSPTRVWEFAIGGLTAVLTARASLGRTTSAVLGLAGLAVGLWRGGLRCVHALPGNGRAGAGARHSCRPRVEYPRPAIRGWSVAELGTPAVDRHVVVLVVPVALAADRVRRLAVSRSGSDRAPRRRVGLTAARVGHDRLGRGSDPLRRALHPLQREDLPRRGGPHHDGGPARGAGGRLVEPAARGAVPRKARQRAEGPHRALERGVSRCPADQRFVRPR